MRRLSLLALLPLTLSATNGDTLIGAGAVSRALGGTAAAAYVGSESIITNPACLTDAAGREIAASATLFYPSVTASDTMGNGETGRSAATFSLIPSAAYVGRIDERTAYGVGLFSVSGMGVDYRDEVPAKGLAQTKTRFGYARLAAAVSRRYGDLSLAVGADAAYGLLDIHASMPVDGGSDGNHAVGGGYHIAAAYRIGGGWEAGAVYTSKVRMKYRSVFDFDGSGTYDALTLSQPAEYAAGLSFRSGQWRIETDVKQIRWSQAEGYKNFEWSDQTVISAGLEYRTGPAVLRAGYSRADSPFRRVGSAAGTISGVPYTAQQIAFFDLVGFPAVTTEHYAAGASYAITSSLSGDIAAVYAPQASVSCPPYRATNEQKSVTLGVTYRFAD